MHGVAYNLEIERDCDLGLVCDFSKQSLTTARKKLMFFPGSLIFTWTLDTSERCVFTSMILTR